MLNRLLAALFLLAPFPASAQLLGDATVPYAAERTVVVDGRSFTGRLFAAPGKQRHEQRVEGIDQVILLRADGRGWLVVPNLRSYVAFGWTKVLQELDDKAVLSTPVGEERVAGLRATKYRVEHAAGDGTAVEGWLWRTAEGIVVKFEGKVRPSRGREAEVAMRLADVRKGPQDPALFELPPGLFELPSGALAPLLGGIAKSG
jgi:hypothetical protein